MIPTLVLTTSISRRQVSAKKATRSLFSFRKTLAIIKNQKKRLKQWATVYYCIFVWNRLKVHKPYNIIRIVRLETP